jgi:hypothetical protein
VKSRNFHQGAIQEQTGTGHHFKCGWSRSLPRGCILNAAIRRSRKTVDHIVVMDISG